jgi:hypothetical protein
MGIREDLYVWIRISIEVGMGLSFTNDKSDSYHDYIHIYSITI